jgi:probable O-glycosylation ligase (exosortase A-associated)
MNPHRLAWGVAYDFPVAAVLGGSTLVGVLITRDPRRLPLTPSTAVLALFIAWILLAWPFSMYPFDDTEMLLRVMKIQLMIFVALAVLHTRTQLDLLIWIVVLSIGFFGVKGGIFTVFSGGSYRIFGPGGFIWGNNEIALALVITLPLMRYLQLQTSRRWVRWGLTAAMLLSALAAIGSYSRGALLAVAGMGLVLWIRTRGKIVSGVVLVIVGLALFSFMPEHWHERMGTIRTYEQDDSAQGRIIAWKTAWNVATDRLFGAGFDMYRPEVFSVYAPVPDRIHAAHSIYFQVLGEHGFVGLGLFLLLWFLVWRDADWLRKNGSRRDSTRWASDLGGMCQVSLVGYFVGGAFLSLAYFDLPYNILIATVLARRLVAEDLQAAQTVSAAEVSPAPQAADAAAAERGAAR